MIAERHAQTGTIREANGSLRLVFDEGGQCRLQAWPGAERYLDCRVHVVGLMTEPDILIANSIAPLA